MRLNQSELNELKHSVLTAQILEVIAIIKDCESITEAVKMLETYKASI